MGSFQLHLQGATAIGSSPKSRNVLTRVAAGSVHSKTCGLRSLEKFADCTQWFETSLTAAAGYTVYLLDY